MTSINEKKINIILYTLFFLFNFSFIFFNGLVDLPMILILIILLIYKKKFNFPHNGEITFFLIFIVYLFIFSLTKIDLNSLSSFKTGFFFFRFFIYTLIFYVLAEKQFIRFNFNILIFLFLLLFIDTAIQLIMGKNTLGYEPILITRLSSFFKDELVLGSYIAKIYPIIIISYIFLSKKINFLKIVIFFLMSFFLIYLSGERTAFFSMIIFNFILFILFLKYKLIKAKELIYIFFFCALITLIPKIHSSFLQTEYCNNQEKKIKYSNYCNTNKDISLKPTPRISLNMLKENFDFNFSYCLSSKSKSKNTDINECHNKNPILNIFGFKIYYFYSIHHHDHALVALEMFFEKPFFGHGIKSFRFKCKDYQHVANPCSSHPHNHLLQFLAETGMVGTLFYLIFYFYFCFKFLLIFFKKQFNKSDLICSIIFITILINFSFLWPSGFLFSSWNANLIFLPIYFYFIFNKKIKI